MEHAVIDALNERFSIPGIAQIIRGNGDLPKILVETKSASAEIYLYGAQVTSWIPTGRDEVLFLSKKSYWEAGRAIRGGIPVCFPWFRAKTDDPHAPSHGFVRIREWRVQSIAQVSEDSVCACLSTESDEASRRWWPYEFRLEYRITVGASLQLRLKMENLGQSTLRFEEALHTYFKVGDVKQAKVRGLDGVAYLDNRDGNREKMQSGDLTLSGQTDNAYKNAQYNIQIVDPVLSRTMITEKQGSASSIVWNPWSEGASSLADMDNEEWREMLCVEGGNILSSAVEVAPHKNHTMTITLSVDE
ncbi:D-hexose-6-phosphate mutarotase [Telmatobacter sp. DSM 110680]|uniref:Putative glucose-6-phosphate 1-epimerase n=1 Tax=Telmatobacter sp. DSM 110680 TaxID=3036704 RepID=A0AAU7DE18_9BACT